MEKSIVYKIQSNDKIAIASTVFLGTALITFCAFIKIPLYPVPFTLQTLAIYILALTQGPKQAFASTLCYLVCATVGLPVFGGRVNPAWIFGKCGGYLVGFPIAAFCMAKIYSKRPAFQALLCGMGVIFFFGLLWLIPIFGLQTAFIKGVLIFVPSEIFKILAAIQLINWRNKR
jgi:biotin transport system substrate-specific component